MTYEELAVLQYGRSKSFADAQTEAMAAYCQAEHDLKQLQQENAKLRELVWCMWGWLTAQTVPDSALHDISGQMHELGIGAER